MNKWCLRYKTISYSKDGKVYFPQTHCEWVGKMTVKKVIIVTMTCGGGMGGSRWSEFLIADDIKDGLQTYTRIDGVKIKINSKYVVRVVYDMYMAKAKYIHYNKCFSDTFGKEQELCVLSDVKDMKLCNEYHTLAEVDMFA